MISYLKGLATSASGMEAHAERMRVISENIANADTPGYQRKLVTFETSYDRAAEAQKVGVERVILDEAPLKQEFDPTHPLADENGVVEYSNVNIIAELADAREARRSYEANLNMFDQARRMYSGVLDLLRQ